jgi:hypothetical protein
MTCEPFCDNCGGRLGHPANGDWTCAKCKGLIAYDRKVEVVENALYRLKERDYADASDVRRIDEFLALPAEFKVDIYDLIRFHAGPEKEA